METQTLETQEFDQPVATGSPPPGFRPIGDPTRSGALWVGGAGVALLLAAAAVLTAVRWDEIGQSVKLGGLVAITLTLLGAGQRFKNTIPMTAQAIFHLGALLIPFDMAAVAILAGRSWQETLLLTSVTSVIAWYGIERAVPSQVLVWCARGAVVALGAGVAAVSSISMPLALAVAAAIAIAVRRPVSAGLWALVAGLLPVAAFMSWPSRIGGAMYDLGFDDLDRWQPLAAGAISTLVLIAVTRRLPRIEIAWSAILVATVTTAVALGGFADAQVSFLSLAGLFVGLELLALATTRDPLWKPIVEVLAIAAEALAVIVTALLLSSSFVAVDSTLTMAGAGTHAVAAALFALGWLIGDRRRLDDPVDWLTGLVLGSDWPVTTVMFPAAILAMVFALSAPAVAVALTAIGLGYWMVATWRSGAVYGAMGLVAVAVAYGSQTTHWTEFALGAVGAAVLMFAAQLRSRSNDLAGSVAAAFAGVLVWLVASQSAVDAFESSWPILLVFAGTWATSWIVEARGANRTLQAADTVGRLTAAVVLVSSLWVQPMIGILLCALAMTFSIIDYLAARHRGLDETSPVVIAYALAAGAALGAAGIPITAAFGLTTATAGATLAVASFVLVGIALVSPRVVELSLGAAAVVAASVGLVMAFDEAGMFAAALMAVGCSTLFVAAALRDVAFGIAGYATVGLGVALQLAVWHVMWLEPYLVLPAGAALYIGYRFHRTGGNSWAAYAPTIALMSYVSIADRLTGGSAWHAVIAGAIGVISIIGGGYRRLVGPLMTGTAVLAIVVGYESLGPAALVPTWAWLAAGGTILLSTAVALERSDTTPLERGQQVRTVIATEFS